MANRRPNTEGLIAFDSTRAREAQAKRFGGVKLKQTVARLYPEQYRWLERQEGTISSVIRRLVTQEMERQTGKRK